MFSSHRYSDDYYHKSKRGLFNLKLVKVNCYICVTVFLIIACALIARSSKHFNVLSETDKELRTSLQNDSVLGIIVGLFMLITGSVGITGLIYEILPLLCTFYCLLWVFVIICFISGIILRVRISDENNITRINLEALISTLSPQRVNRFQSNYRCCGIDKYTDYITLWKLWGINETEARFSDEECLQPSPEENLSNLPNTEETTTLKEPADSDQETIHSGHEYSFIADKEKIDLEEDTELPIFIPRKKKLRILDQLNFGGGLESLDINKEVVDRENEYTFNEDKEGIDVEDDTDIPFFKSRRKKLRVIDKFKIGSLIDYPDLRGPQTQYEREYFQYDDTDKIIDQFGRRRIKRAGAKNVTIIKRNSEDVGPQHFDMPEDSEKEDTTLAVQETVNEIIVSEDNINETVAEESIRIEKHGFGNAAKGKNISAVYEERLHLSKEDGNIKKKKTSKLKIKKGRKKAKGL